MRTVTVSCMLVALGLVLLPSATFAYTCPAGANQICWGVAGGEWTCKCVYSSATKHGTPPSQKPKGPFQRVRPNHNIGPAD